jgi:hypothetical protein
MCKFVNENKFSRNIALHGPQKAYKIKPIPGRKTNVIIHASTLAIDRGFRKTVINAPIVLITISPHTT